MITRLLTRILTPASIEWKSFRWKLAIVAVGCVAIFYGERHILVTVSASVDDRIFWRTGDEPEKGDYATFMFSHPLAGAEPVRLTKRLVCWEGDVLTIEGRNHFCNGEPLGVAKTIGLNGKPLPLFVYNDRVPEGKAFAFGAHVDSFDSRYWGLVDVGVTERLVPIYGSQR